MPRFLSRSGRMKAAFYAPLIVVLLLAGWASVSHAQQLPGGTDQLQLLQQYGLGTGVGGLNGLGAGAAGANTTDLPQSNVLQPVSPGSQPPLPPSRLEQIMSARAGARLRQFGYDQLGRGAYVQVPQTGAVQDDYILGPGDELFINLRGQENSALRIQVDRNGQVVIPRLTPVPATGRTFGDFRRDLEDAVRRGLVGTQVSVAVGKTRQISVLVSGEVNAPGQRLLTGLSSAVDALLLSGGIKKTGSLRNVRIERNGHQINIDLYSVLTTGAASASMRLADGDRILVPPLGKTVAISGLVRQPGIYELPSGASSMTASALMALSGGLEVRGQYRLSVLRILPDGSTQMATLANENGAIGDSEIMFVQLGADQTVNQATLSGESPLAGQYPITTGTKLSDVLKAPGAMPPQPYTLFGIIARKDPRTLLRKLVAFTPVAVLNGGEDEMLQSDDIIRLLSVNEVRLLTNTVRLYSERQAAEQAAIRNPLSGPDQTATTVPQSMPAAAVPTTGATGAAGAIGAVGAAGASTPSVNSALLAQANATALQAQLNASDQSTDLADMQRRDIAELANTVDPVTLQADLAAAQAQRQQAAEQSQEAANLAAAGSQAQGQNLVQLAGQGASTQLPVLTQPGGGGQSSSTNLTDTAPPALNFESTDSATGQIARNRSISNFGDLARQLGVDQLVLVNFLMDHQVDLSGAVSGPGYYFVGPNVPLQDLVSAAGGTTNWADESGVELITTAVDNPSGQSATRRVQLPLRQGMLASYVVHPKDEFRFNQVFTDANIGTATVQGEVHFTGTYQITRGEHLSDLLARAGGLTGTAYPYGTVFLRKSAAAIERDGYNRAANEIEEELVVAMTRIGNDKIDASSFASLQTFVSELRNQRAVGRIAIAADPSALAAKPELDPLLEPDDVIYIPQRPSTISVLGQVMQPGSLPYRSTYTLRDYIEMAGGYSPTSESSNTFIVLPDGSARKVETSWLGFQSDEALPPGSAIVVPRDVTPLDTRQLILDVSGILSQLAVSVASLAVINHN